MTDLLKVCDLRIAFHSRGKSNEVVNGIDFSVHSSGHVVAILGESGSGKSVSCLALTKLLPKAPECTVTGQVFFKGKEVLEMNAGEIRTVRGRGIAYIFQEPSSSPRQPSPCGTSASPHTSARSTPRTPPSRSSRCRPCRIAA